MRALLTPEEAARVPSLFAEAQALALEQQAAYLAQACAGAEGLRTEVESLLGFRSRLPELLARPAVGRGLELLGLRATGGLTPGTLLGEYRILSVLGVGGMGEVYLADDTVHGRKVALKLIGQGRAEEVRSRHFRHERKVLATLNHPHIARLYGSGVTPDGQAYLIMEYVEGKRLDQFCQDGGLDVEARLELFGKVCAAVSDAHRNLVVHRDLKPANIRVTPDGEPKLLDFGIAKLMEGEGTASTDPTLTLHGTMTPEYASPEQIKGEPITTATDVYSLGVVLYELLTGDRPYSQFKGRRADELARAICEEEPPRPSSVLNRQKAGGRAKSAKRRLPGAMTQKEGETTKEATTEPGESVSRSATYSAFFLSPSAFSLGDLDNIVAKALRKEPERRYASVAALADDIRRHRDGLPVAARGDTFGYRAAKFVCRRKAGVAAGAAVVVALVAGLIVATWQARVALRERDRAHVAQRQAERLDAFLEELLGSTDPLQMGKDVKVSQVLDAAGQKIDRDLAAEPEVLIRAHQTLGRSYRHLGLFVPAERQARAALDLERRLRGVGDPETANAEVTLADALNARHQWPEADDLLRHALGVLRLQPAPDHATLADALRASSYSLAMQGRTDQAEPVIVEALSHAKAAWGEQSSEYANVLAGLATVKFNQRNYVAAEELYRRLLALQDRLFPGGEHSFLPLGNLGIALFNQDKLAEARRVAKRMEQDARRLLGEKSVYFALAIHSQGVVDFVEGNYQAAIPLFQKALPLLSAAYPPGQMALVHCRALLGLCLTRTGQAVEGEPLLRTAFADGSQVDPFEFAHTLGNLETALGECLLAQKRYTEAEPLLFAGYTDLEKRLGPQDRLASQACRRLQGLYLILDKPTEAMRFDRVAAPQPFPTP